jgi:hypothetical protein
MSDLLYKKKKNRYVPVGHEFSGWPADGVWLVEKGGLKAHLFMELPTEHIVNIRCALEKYKEELTDSIIKGFVTGSKSSMDMAQDVLNDLCTLVEKDMRQVRKVREKLSQ